jgi:transcription antitermination factor NusG
MLEMQSEANSEARWYVAQTRSRHEKRVAKQLQERGIEHYLALYETVSRWKDRRVRLDLPLFPGYVFVHMALQERLRVLDIPSVVRLVGFGGLPVPITDYEMESLRVGLMSKRGVEPHPHLTAGRHVRIRSGPLAGLEGILIRKKGNYRLAISVKLIERSVLVEVDLCDLEPSIH